MSRGSRIPHQSRIARVYAKVTVDRLKRHSSFFPEYSAVPVFSKEALLKIPGLNRALLEMQDILKDKNMSALIERFKDKLGINDEIVCCELTKEIIKSC